MIYTGKIKGITVEIGGNVGPLNKALGESEKAGRALGSELKEINKALKFDTNSVTLAKQKQDVLKDSISATSDKLKVLKTAQSQVKAQYKSGEIDSGQYRAFQRELITTKSKLQDLKKQKDVLAPVKAGFAAAGEAAEKLHKKLAPVESGLKKIGSTAVSVGSGLATVGGAGLKTVSSAVGAAGKTLAVYTGAATTASIASAGLASDLDEVQNVVDTTFGAANAKKIDSWAKDASNAYGLSELSAKQYTGTMGAMLKSMGMSQEATYDMSTSLVGLSGDLASFYNLDGEEAFEKIRAGISGETEPLKQLGINMSVANLEAFALSKGIDTAYQSMSQSEQATLRYQYLMSVTADAQGDFAKTSEGFANQTRIAGLQVKSLSAAFGQNFLPVANGALKSFTKEMPKITESMTAVFAGDSGAAESLTGGITRMITGAVENLSQNLPQFLTGFNALLSGILTALVQSLPAITQTLIPQIITGLSSLIQSIVRQLPVLLPLIVDAALQLFLGLIDGLNQVIQELIPMLPDIITRICDTLIENLPALIEGGFQLLIGLIQGITECTPTLIDKIVELIPVMTQALTDNLPALIDAGVELIVALAEGLPKAIPAIIKAIPEIIGAIINALMEQDWLQIGVDILKGIGEGLLEGVKAIGGVIKDAASGLINGFKSLFGIQSPSTLFRDEIGANLAAGLGEGFTDGMAGVRNEMEKAVPTSFDTKITSSVAANNVGGMNTVLGGGLHLHIENFYNSRAQDTQALMQEMEFYRRMASTARGVV